MSIAEAVFILFLRVREVVVSDIYTVHTVRWECDSFKLRELAAKEALKGERSWSSCHDGIVRSEIPQAAFESVVRRSDSAKLLR